MVRTSFSKPALLMLILAACLALAACGEGKQKNIALAKTLTFDPFPEVDKCEPDLRGPYVAACPAITEIPMNGPTLRLPRNFLDYWVEYSEEPEKNLAHVEALWPSLTGHAKDRLSFDVRKKIKLKYEGKPVSLEDMRTFAQDYDEKDEIGRLSSLGPAEALPNLRLLSYRGGQVLRPDPAVKTPLGGTLRFFVHGAQEECKNNIESGSCLVEAHFVLSQGVRLRLMFHQANLADWEQIYNASITLSNRFLEEPK